MDFAALEKRHLPYEGGIRDQPADMMMDWRVIIAEESEHRRRQENDETGGSIGAEPEEYDETE